MKHNRYESHPKDSLAWVHFRGIAVSINARTRGLESQPLSPKSLQPHTMSIGFGGLGFRVHDLGSEFKVKGSGFGV